MEHGLHTQGLLVCITFSLSPSYVFSDMLYVVASTSGIDESEFQV